MDATPRLVPRAEETQTQPANQSNSSVFTFLIALLILLCTSAAVVFRALLMRRRFRRRVQNALDAGILLPTRPVPEEKPLLWDIWVRGTNNARDWDSLMPVCATNVPDNTIFEQKTPPRSTISYDASRGRRIMEILGQSPTLSSITVQPAEPVKEPSACSTTQVVFLIALPSLQPTIPIHDPSTISSPKGKEKDADAHDDVDMDTFPDVMFGVSTFVSLREDIP